MYCFVIFQKGLRSVFDASSQTAWFFYTTSNIYHYIPTNSHKTLTNYISVFTGRSTLSIDENCMKIRSVVFEFLWADRQTDRRGGGLCFIICIDDYTIISTWADSNQWWQWELFKNYLNIVLSHLPRGMFPVSLLVNIFKAFQLPSSQEIYPAYFSLPDLFTLTLLREEYKL